MTICCGDSHTSTHGAFGAIAFGIGTSQVRDVLATQCLAMDKLKVRRIEVNGRAAPGRLREGRHPLRSSTASACTAASATPTSTRGDVFDRFSMEERMTVCNMSIEGGARCGYVNPDQTTYDYLRGREFAPGGRGLGSRRRLLGLDALRSGRALRRRRAPARRGHRAGRHLGHHARAVDAGRRRPARSRRVSRTASARWSSEAYRYMQLEPGQAASAARRSTSPSSARAPTAASPTSRRSCGTSRAAASRSRRT